MGLYEREVMALTLARSEWGEDTWAGRNPNLLPSHVLLSETNLITLKRLYNIPSPPHRWWALAGKTAAAAHARASSQ